MRRSLRNGQLRSVSSLFAGSHSTTRISSLPLEASEITWPKGSATKELPQNSNPGSPFSGLPSKPTRFTTAAYTPLAMACPRWMVRHASDRKSTRLNSSHDQISYAVFCLTKKKQKCFSMEAGKDRTEECGE